MINEEKGSTIRWKIKSGDISHEISAAGTRRRRPLRACWPEVSIRCILRQERPPIRRRRGIFKTPRYICWRIVSLYNSYLSLYIEVYTRNLDFAEEIQGAPFTLGETKFSHLTNLEVGAYANLFTTHSYDFECVYYSFQISLSVGFRRLLSLAKIRH